MFHKHFVKIYRGRTKNNHLWKDYTHFIVTSGSHSCKLHNDIGKGNEGVNERTKLYYHENTQYLYSEPENNTMFSHMLINFCWSSRFDAQSVEKMEAVLSLWQWKRCHGLWALMSRPMVFKQGIYVIWITHPQHNNAHKYCPYFVVLFVLISSGMIRNWDGTLQIMEANCSPRLMPRKSGHPWWGLETGE